MAGGVALVWESRVRAREEALRWRRHLGELGVLLLRKFVVERDAPREEATVALRRLALAESTHDFLVSQLRQLMSSESVRDVLGRSAESLLLEALSRDEWLEVQLRTIATQELKHWTPSHRFVYHIRNCMQRPALRRRLVDACTRVIVESELRQL